jgi:hypothetical protein
LELSAVRLSNARETEKRLVAVLQQRTGKVSDVLEVEREIARVRGEIERMTTSREQLRDRARYATVTVRVTEEARASLDLGTPSAAARLRNAFVQGVSNAAEGALAVSVWVIGITPTLLLFTLVFAWPLTLAWNRFRPAP